MGSNNTIAPADIIIADYMSLLNQVELKMDEKYRKLLLMQSVIGHAQNGHVEFKGRIYENTSIDDVVDALASSKNPKIHEGLGKISKSRVKKLRDKVLEILINPFERIMAGEDVKSLTNKKGKPLLGISSLKEAKIRNKEAFLIGGYLASRMDAYINWREEVEEKYGVEMGGGECVAVDLEELPSKLTLNNLSEAEWGKALDILKKEGIVIDIDKEGVDTGIIREDGTGNVKKVKSSDTRKNAYVRHKLGKGVSDDAAIIIAGKIYGEEAFWGAYLFDAIDTWDKYSTWIIDGGMDEAFGNKLRKHISITKDEVLKFIFLARKGSKFPDSSQRYMLEINQEFDQTALESHLKFLRGENYTPMGIGHRRGPARLQNSVFYQKLEQRLKRER